MLVISNSSYNKELQQINPKGLTGVSYFHLYDYEDGVFSRIVLNQTGTFSFDSLYVFLFPPDNYEPDDFINYCSDIARLHFDDTGVVRAIVPVLPPYVESDKNNLFLKFRTAFVLSRFIERYASGDATFVFFGESAFTWLFSLFYGTSYSKVILVEPVVPVSMLDRRGFSGEVVDELCDSCVVFYDDHLETVYKHRFGSRLSLGYVGKTDGVHYPFSVSVDFCEFSGCDFNEKYKHFLFQKYYPTGGGELWNSIISIL